MTISVTTAAKPRPYFTMLEREGLGMPWGIAFGDYSAAVVRQECRDRHDNGVRTCNLLIVQTSDRQADIDIMVRELNANGISFRGQHVAPASPGAPA